MTKIYRYLSEIAKEQSFSKAAKNLYISQPALSVMVKNYEDEIGIQIFDRSSTPIQLTDIGREYIDGIERILAIEEELQVLRDDSNKMASGKLTLGAASLSACYLFPRFVELFQAKYPNIEVALKETDMFALNDLLTKGDLDIIVEANDFDDKLFTSVPLFKEQLLLVVPRDNPLNNELTTSAFTVDEIRHDIHTKGVKREVELSIFKKEPFILLEKGHDTRVRILKMCEDAGFKPRVTLVANQLMTAYNLANSGAGVTFVSDTLVKLYGREDNVFLYNVKNDLPQRYFKLVYKKNRYISKSMKAFIDLMVMKSKDGLNAIFEEEKTDSIPPGSWD